MAGGHETPTYPQYTNLALHNGLFDQLLAAHQHHLDLQYDNQRIRGDKYAEVYLGSMESVLANSTQYLLGILLLDERRKKMIAETDLIIVETAKAQFEVDVLMPLQAEKLQAEIDLLRAQIEKIEKEIEFLTAKIVTERANTEDIADPNSLIGRQIQLLKAQKIGFAGDIQTKTAKLFADYDAVLQSVQETPEMVTLNPDAQLAIDKAEAFAVEIGTLP